MAELLVELLSEDLKRLVTDRLKAAGLDYSAAEAHVTPLGNTCHKEPERSMGMPD